MTDTSTCGGGEGTPDSPCRGPETWGGGCVPTGAEMAVMQLQDKDHQPSPAAATKSWAGPETASLHELQREGGPDDTPMTL